MNILDTSRRGTILNQAPPFETAAPAGGAATAESQPVVANLVSIVRRQKWVILGCVVGALLLGVAVTMLMTPLYTAAATIEIQRETGNIAGTEDSEEQSRQASLDQEFYQTQYGLLEARSLAEAVALDLRLVDDPAFFEMFDPGEAGEWFVDGRLAAGASTREERARVAGEILLGQISVEPERQSRLVRLEFTSPDPALSKRVVDSWSENFVEQTLERRFDATSYAREFLEERLGQLRTRINESEQQLVDYAARQGIVNLPSNAVGGVQSAGTVERSLIAEDVVALNRELAQATADRIEAQSRLSGAGASTTESLDNLAIGRMRERRAELAADHARLMTQFEPEYPPAAALQSQLDEIDQAISREEGRVSRTLQETYRAANAREAALQARLEGLKGGLVDERRRSIQYNIIEREVDTNRQLYDALLQRYKEIGVAGGVGINNISVVDQAELPSVPSSPNLLLNLGLALLLGAGLGIAAALVLEQLDEGVADPSETMQLLGAPLLGTVPVDADNDPVHSLDDPKSVLSEAYLSLRTSLSFATDHGVPKSFAVTSTRPAEGKSTTSVALARALARSNVRTLLVDGDMRSPSLHSLFEVKNRLGLSNFLSGTEDLEELVHATPVANLSLMTAGPQPPNAAELLSSERFRHLLQLLGTRFDHIVVDAPPVLGLADAPLIGNAVEGVVFVLEAHGTKKGSARVAISRLRAAHAQVIGGVITKFDAQKASYGYGYDYGYGYSYGDKKGS